MAHWAELDKNNQVIRVVVGNDNDPNGDEGYKWLADNLGGSWVQTSYNSNFRKHFAAIGYTYNESLDAFIPPKPHPSWQLNEKTCQWEAPTPYPDNGFTYTWNESSLAWDLANFSEPEA